MDDLFSEGESYVAELDKLKQDAAAKKAAEPEQRQLKKRKKGAGLRDQDPW